MYTLRPVTTAFIFQKQNVLLIKRSEHKKIHPGKWSGIGGHIENNELTNPRKACLREISEENGLRESDFEKFALRYIVFSKKGHEFWQQFVYFGNSRKQEVSFTYEGELHWVPQNEVLELSMSITHHSILDHFLST